MAAMVLDILYSGVCLLYAIPFLIPTVSAYICTEYTDHDGDIHPLAECGRRFCCGSCEMRYCCYNDAARMSEKEQGRCSWSKTSDDNDNYVNDLSDSRANTAWSTIISSITPIVIGVILVIAWSCALRKCRERRSQPVVAGVVTTTTTQQLSAFPASPHQGTQYPAYQHPVYQPVPTQPGYGTQVMPLDYEGQPIPSTPPPSYGEIVGPGYPHAPMPYSQAAFTPGQPGYPLQPPAQPNAPSLPQPVYPLQPPAQPNAPSPPQLAYPPQQAYNPSYAEGPRH